MSEKYDEYLKRHREAVRQAYQWIEENIPGLRDSKTARAVETHDASKNEPDEYEAYDAYFYGRKTRETIERFNEAWLTHIHRNPHHWQHWVLINDDPEEGTVVLEMPYPDILEMICDWWAFSWVKGDRKEIFQWYDARSQYIRLAPKTRMIVEDILGELRRKLEDDVLVHHGIKGQKWGVRNGPPYPLDRSKKSDTIVEDAINSGEVSKTINREKQLRHTKSNHAPGRSYLDGDLDYAQELVDRYSGKGETKTNRDGSWNHRERITANRDIGVYVDEDGNETRSNTAMIIYSKTGTHIYPARRKESK